MPLILIPCYVRGRGPGLVGPGRSKRTRSRFVKDPTLTRNKKARKKSAARPSQGPAGAPLGWLPSNPFFFQQGSPWQSFSAAGPGRRPWSP